ncbi:MAG: hypothetical protein J0G30_08025 [Actinomycetales bacterium]|nr:hypothetical protein [Actinomycetales bacterium]
MNLITRERNRLLQRTARVYGLSFAVVALLMVVLPGAVDVTTLLATLPLFLVLGLAQVRMGASASPGWVLAALAAGAGIIVVVTTVGQLRASAVPAVMALAAASLPACAIVLTTSGRRIALLVLAFLGLGAVTVLLLSPVEPPLRSGGLILLGWTLPTLVGIWIIASVPQVSQRIASIGRAHRAERQASELEAQRRQSARLLHDTVLATLTLLAHSGVGVPVETLRQQAADDAALLRQLRLGLGGPPEAPAGSPPPSTPTDETPLGTTLESVKQRFNRMGLEVAWHGTGQVLLRSDVLDAFLLALAECLENVRRHSGVTQASVTITEDATTVRALVTDSGVGFDLDDVDDAKLGFKESVVARLHDVGGNARLYSTPGAGTTVALEVPR